MKTERGQFGKSKTICIYSKLYLQLKPLERYIHEIFDGGRLLWIMQNQWLEPNIL